MRIRLVASLAWQDYRNDAWLSACAVLALVAVVGLAKMLTPSVENVLRVLNVPREFIGIVIAALVLLPEIALSAEFLDRVEARFGARPGEWHSGVTRGERRRLWTMAAQHHVGLVVGARSALFLPFADLGLIVVDEEHDSSYKQEDTVYYSARDMAVLRASIASSMSLLL